MRSADWPAHSAFAPGRIPITLRSVAGAPDGDFAAGNDWKYVPPSPPGRRPMASNAAATYSAAASRPPVPTPRPSRSGAASHCT